MQAKAANLPASVRVPASLRVIDSHTAGEPTRVVLPPAPTAELDLTAAGGSLAARLERLRTEHDHLRRAILCEPRGSEVLVGAWLLEPDDPGSAAAVIFFNNTGYLGMCGHGSIGVAATLAHTGRIGPGEHRLETPVGTVRFELHSAHRATIHNVPAYRHRAGVTVDVPEYGSVTGDVAWGGNWFFLVAERERSLTLANVEELTRFTWAIRLALRAQGVNGAEGAEIDHVELCTAAHDAANDGRNFVLCPGREWDRSPCGTGTSAKMACLAAEGKLKPGGRWRQEGILGTVFEGSIEVDEAGRVLPSITGEAWVTAESTLLFGADDPFRAGIGA